MELTDIFTATGIKQSSAELYAKNIRALNQNKPISSTTFLKDVQKTLQKIAHLKPTTQRSYIISVVSFLKTQPPTKQNKKMLDEYTEIMNNLNERLRTSNEKTEAETENWMTPDELQATYDELYDIAREIMRKRVGHDDITATEYMQILKLMVFALYHLTPPRRNADYQKMKFAGHRESSDFNYIDIENREFIFNNYKTNRKYAQQITEIPEELANIINIYMRYMNPDSGYFLVKYNGQPLRNVNDITRILNMIFKRRVGTQMLRKMYHTDKYARVMENLEDDARKMGHSVGVVKSHYLKK